MARKQKSLKKKELREDPLMTAITQSQVWLAEHGKQLVIGIIAVVVVIIAVKMLSNMRLEADLESRQAFADVQLEIAQTAPEDIIPLLLRVVDDYDGTSGGAEALYSAAELALNEKDYEQAGELFSRFLNEYKGEHLLAAGAKGGLATVLENQGRFEEAASMFTELANNKWAAHYRYYALLSAGHCYASAGQEDRAREMYQTILDEGASPNFTTPAEYELAKLEVTADHIGLP